LVELEEAAIQIRNRIQPEGLRVKDEVLRFLAEDFFRYSEKFNSGGGQS
jgi:hypothetical protein